MGSNHEIVVYEYVSRPVERVRNILRRDGNVLFARASATATERAQSLVGTLRASVGPVEVGADVVVHVTSVKEEPHTPLGPRVRLTLDWKALKHPELFPTMAATLDVYSLGPEETQLDFRGNYEPPLGVVGAAIDALVGHRVAQAAVHRFVSEVAERLRAEPS